MGPAIAPPAVSTVLRLLERACALGASDLHLEPSEAGVQVIARRDGILEPLEILPAELGPRIVGRLKALADLLAYRTDVPQEGRIPAESSGVGREFRVATFPTLLGERVALRVDTPDGTPSNVAELGLPPDVEWQYRQALRQPEGVILLTGPSGSGKTTTLYAGLKEIATAPIRRSAITIEDPIERRIEGVTQTQVNTPAGLTWDRALRSLLRQDPDVLLVGEIRDPETAGIVLEAGLTGHLVASTVHAGTGPQVFTRLLEMGIEPYVLTTAIRGVLAQRLVRCVDAQGHSSGRVLCAEWLPVEGAVRSAILAREDATGIEQAARRVGWRSLHEDAGRLVRQGRTTQREVDRVLGAA